MSILKADKQFYCNGVMINEYLLTKHNPYKINMPYAVMNNIIGITVHNTDWINVANNTTPAEQYTRVTINGNMKSTRVHYYVDNVCAWQNLPLTLSGWHAADGDGDGNRKTISIECIMSKAYNDKDKKSEDNCARLVAYLLKAYNLDINNLYTHTYWLHKCRKNGYGITGNIDKMNTEKHPYKTCPIYIIPHWQTFKNKVEKYLNDLKKSNTTINTNTTVINTANNYIYKVKVLDDCLNIRKEPNINSKIVGQITNHSIYTIIEEKSNNGVVWGKLKSGAGWISTHPKYVKKV